MKSYGVSPRSVDISIDLSALLRIERRKHKSETKRQKKPALEQC